MVKEFISQLPPDKLSPFAKHPYQVREDAAMDELVESVRTYGILSPLLARPKGEGYELVSGHRRRLAAQKLGLPTVPVLVREMSDDEAVILMVDSNLQRENLLPSEKAFAYKMKLEAMNRQGRRTDLTSTTVVPKFRSNEVIGKESGESRETVRRYIRLTNLVPPLLQMVDDGRIAFSPAVELSYLTRDEQAELWDLIGREDATPSLSQSLRMKQLSREAKLTPEVLYAILTEEKPNQKEQIRIKTESLRKYFPRNYSAQQMERENIEEGRLTVSTLYSNYRFVKGDITDRDLLAALFDAEHFDIVCNLAAQAGVRYSLVNPYAYAESNLMGFLNILEACRHHHIEHLVYASSSSVYGMNEKVPFCETDMTDTPVSLYAATKKSNELMAHAYSNLYHIPATGLRFFTVYGPWGRPDMAPYLFMKSITKGEPIRVFNHGKMRRDFTYIDDIIQAVVRIIGSKPYEAEVPFRVYNIGHSRPVELMDFIHCIERATGKEAVCRYEEMQPGDVTCTYADTTRLEEDFQYAPSTEIQDGIQRMYEWFKHWMAR